jgi:adenine-specific DNA-methyltransferase
MARREEESAPYFETRKGDDWLITNCPCVLVQRTTAKEQNRRLIAAALPPQFVFRHGAVVVENHLNMIKPTVKRPPVSADVLAAFLNSAAADGAFRCVSGSVAVSAYELEAMPLPRVDSLDFFVRLVRENAPRDQLESTCVGLYGRSPVLRGIRFHGSSRSQTRSSFSGTVAGAQRATW